MTFDDDLTACAQLVERGDPLRFRAVMAAPVAARRVLFPLYAFNVEVARAPWVTQETMIAEMRLQWWRDALAEIAAGGAVRRHQVVTPLAGVLSPRQAEMLDQSVAARRWDIYRDPFEDQTHFERFIDQTAGTLMWVGASALGASEEGVVRDYAWAAGAAAWMRAIPELEARGRLPLLDGRAPALRALAEQALTRLDEARCARASVAPSARPALLAGWQAGHVLKQAAAQPDRVAAGQLGRSPAADQLSLIWQALTGRW